MGMFKAGIYDLKIIHRIEVFMLGLESLVGLEGLVCESKPPKHPKPSKR